MFGDLFKRMLGFDGGEADERRRAERESIKLLGDLGSLVNGDPNRIIILGSDETPAEMGEFARVFRERPAATTKHEDLLREFFHKSGFSLEDARRVLRALIKAGAPHYDGDPGSDMLCQIIAHPAALSGVRIESITKGPGLHQVPFLMGLMMDEIRVPDGEILVTINSTGIFKGELATFVFREMGEGLIFERKVVHLPEAKKS